METKDLGGGMEERKGRAWRALMALAAWIGALAGTHPAVAVVVDFESAVYIHGNTIDQVDGWSRSTNQGGQPESFRVHAEGSGQGVPGNVVNKWLRVSTEGVGTLHRTFPSNAGLLDLQWRWRAGGSGADLCLGVSGSTEDVRSNARALVCFHPGGAFEVSDALSLTLKEADATWEPGAVYFMRLRLDAVADQYTVHLASDSLRGDERLIAGPYKMGGILSAPLTRVVVRPEGGASHADIDDIQWETVAAWKGAADSLASNPRNWSTGLLPDSLTQIAFGAAASRACVVDKPLSVRAVEVDSAFPYGLHFGTVSLSVSGRADFSGLASLTTVTGGLRLTSSRAQSLVGSPRVPLPPIHHEGTGVLRLDGRALKTRALSHSAGTLDLNGHDLTVETDLLVTNGGPATFRSLAGRTLAAGKTARFEGTPASRVNLKAPSPWHLSGLQEVTARYAEIQNCAVQGSVGTAHESVNGGGNLGWVFAQSSADSVLPPRFNPAGKAFTGSLTVVLEPATEGSTLYFTTNGSQPTAQPANRYSAPIVLTASATIRAMAVKAGMTDSRVVSESYTRINVQELVKPVVSPNGGSFSDSVLVTLGHPDLAPDGPAITLYYRLDDNIPVRYDRPFHVRPPAILRAFAMRGGEQSDTAIAAFLRRPAPPAILPAGGRFPDTLRITLDSDEDDVALFYTLNGRDPDSTSARYLGRPILLDSTATLKAVAARAGAGLSLVRSETFELVPDSLTANYQGGDYSSAIRIKLKVTSLRARIHYTLDGSAPGPGNPASRPYVEGEIGFPLDTTATLRAVAVAGEGATYRVGRELTARYTFIDAGVRTLGPGQRVEISPRYSVSNPFPGAPAVQVEVIKADSLAALRGFRDVQFGMDISLPSQSGAYPQVVFAAPAGEERALYSLSPAGVVKFVSSDDTVPLPSTGTYFLGVDTLPPKVAWSGENFHGDSTRILFNIQDNVSSLLLDLERSDAEAVRARPLDNPHILTVTLKAPPGPVAPLWLRFKVDDRRNATRFPADPSAVYPLSQKSLQAVRSPEVMKVGARSDSPWDMVSIPLDAPGRFTLARLRQENPGRVLAAKVMDAASGAYRDLKAGEALRPGMAVWLASDASLPSLVLGPLQTAARQGRDTVQVTLRPGWNQVANPTLRDLLWPHPRGAPGSETSLIKGLHGYDPSLPGTGYFDTDTLKPWKGYFVHYKGTRDTSISLRAATGAPAAKRAAGPASGVSLRIVLDRLPALLLGALPSADDGLGVEDEPQPPAPAADAPAGPRLWSSRQRLRLGTDILGFRPGGMLTWRVVAAGNMQDTSATRGARIEGLSLPEGYAAWAVSRSRGLRFVLREGARIPLGVDLDSLDVHAGPAALLEARLGGIPERVDGFRLRAAPRDGGYALDLALPSAARVAWRLWSLDGRTLDAGSRVLPPGRYRLDRGVRGYRGAGVLRLEWNVSGAGAAAGRGREVRRLVLP